MIRSVIFEGNFDNVLKLIVVLPERIKNGKTSPEEFYNYLVLHAGFGNTSYSNYISLLTEIFEKQASAPKPQKKTELGMLTILRMIEEKNAAEVQKNPSKSRESLIFSIKNQQKQHEKIFESPTKDLDQELFEYLASKLTKNRISVSQLFEVIDKNQDGRVSTDEFSMFLKKIGYSLSKIEVKSIMKCIDYNCDDFISFKEFMVKLKAFGYTEV